MGDPRRRLPVALLIVLLLLSVVGVRLFQLQGVDASDYADQAAAQRMRTVTLTADRGEILDRDGKRLASTVEAREIFADPSLIEDPAKVARTLSPLLGIDVATLTADMSKSGRYVPLLRSADVALAQRVATLNILGIGFQPETRRVHPDGTLAASVLGFTNSDGIGRAGLELAYNSTLAGTDGSATYEVDKKGRHIPSGISKTAPATPGSDLQLTLDSNIQWMAQQRLQQALTESDADSGTVIVMDPTTGAVLALATGPGMDTNDPGAATEAERGDPAVSDVYEPGSVNKVITAAAALETGVVTPTSPVTVPPTLPYGPHVFHDAEVHGTEHLTFAGVLAHSSNIGTILTYEKVGDAKLYQTLREFGFGDKTGIGLPGESRGLLPDVANWNKLTGPTISFGQGISVTPVQVASVYATIANDGVRAQPHVLDAVVGPDGTKVAAPQDDARRVVSARTAQQIREMLEGAVSDQGTAPAAQIAGYRVAGKTGTSQRVDPACSCYRGYTASFVGMAPADHPKLVVAVIIQNPKNSHYGGTVSAPVFHDVMSFALQTQGVQPTGTAAPKIPLTVGG